MLIYGLLAGQTNNQHRLNPEVRDLVEFVQLGFHHDVLLGVQVVCEHFKC